MNIRGTVWGTIAGCGVLLIWLVLAVSFLRGVPFWFCLTSALLGSIAVGLLTMGWIAGGPWMSSVTGITAVLLALIFPLSAFLYGLSWNDGATAGAPRASGAGPPYALRLTEEDYPETTTGRYVREGDHRDAARAVAERASRGGIVRTTHTPDVGRGLTPLTPPVQIEDDGSGGGTIVFRVPGAPSIVHTKWTIARGQVFYVRTPHIAPNIQFGGSVPGTEQVRWLPVPASRFNLSEPHCIGVNSLPTAELVVSTGAMPQGTYTVYVQKNPGPLGLTEYQPGRLAGRMY